ncbi:MAG: glutamine-hydrolyzing GMP synthase [Oscillospiraceae bacterium]|jgi:GMP synthase (glutamine-hydrolysing)|nr:glutamine-hydrolyzing GMP synthase [Oscillospiraceae bacterium]
MSKIVVLDFGGQYKELIARRVRSLNVYSEVHPGRISADELKTMNPDGIILTGGPNSVYLPDSQTCDPGIFGLGVPVLGICYGMQLMVHTLGGKVAPGEVSEFGVVDCEFRGTNRKVLMSHGDRVFALPEGFRVLGSTKDCPIAACENVTAKLYAVQFHPEVTHTERGIEIIQDFLFNVCKITPDYYLDDVIDTLCEQIRGQVGGDRVLLGLSGGVDSSVVAALLSKAIPSQTLCVFVDHGLMRLNEGDQIESVFSKRDLEFARVNAETRFLSKLTGVTDPESKRKIIGEEFARVFEDVAKSRGNTEDYFLAQGTIYPDVIESGDSKTGGADVIKSHHNVGGLPKDLKFKGLVEPLRGLFKDEVRALGRKLGLPPELVERQPFPGPGLGIRVIGDITKDKLDVLRKADAIFRESIDGIPFEERPAQYFAVLTDLRAVGVTGDARSYGNVLALRAVYTDDFMTCRYVPLTHELLNGVSQRITNEIRSIGRVVYDITDKPPATLEWE